MKGLILESDKIQVDRILDILKDGLKDNLKAVFLFGSSVQGGLKNDSDLDFLVVVKSSLSKEDRSFLIGEIGRNSKRIGQRINLRYVELTIVLDDELRRGKFPIHQEFLYGEWLREEYEKGYLSKREVNEDLTILVYQISKQTIQIYGEESYVFPKVDFNDVKYAIKKTAKDIVSDYRGDERNVILTLCRMLVTLETREIVSKDVAGIRLRDDVEKNHRILIDLAVRDYQGLDQVEWDLVDISGLVGDLYYKINS